MKSGIYIIKNKINNKIYVGSSLRLKTRWSQHKSQLRNGIHHNIYLQRAWDKYGENNFEFLVLEIIDDYRLMIEKESYYINLYKSLYNLNGYNLSPNAGGQKGFKHSEKTKKLISIKGKGRKHSEETKRKISESNKGKKMSEESIIKRVNKMKGKNIIYSEKGLEARRLAAIKAGISRKGKKLSLETRQKMSESRKGKSPSEETRKKLSIAHKKENWSEERIKKASDDNRGSNNPLAKLNEEKVTKIKEMLIRKELGEITITLLEIANEFNVSKGAIDQIKARKTWDFVTVEGFNELFIKKEKK